MTFHFHYFPGQSNPNPSSFATQLLHHNPSSSTPIHPTAIAPSSSSTSSGQQLESGLQSAEESLTTPDSDAPSTPSIGQQPQHQQSLSAVAATTGPSLSPRSSLSSASPPVSPQVDLSNLPPNYEGVVGTNVSAERQRRIQQHLAEAKQV